MNGSTAALPDEMKCFICRSKGGLHSQKISIYNIYISYTFCHPSSDNFLLGLTFLVCPGEYGIGSRPVPDVGEGEVLVRVLAVGICAGDAKCYAGAARYWGIYP